MLSKLMAAWSWKEYFDEYLTDANAGTKELLNKVFSIISIILWVVLAIVGAVGAVYAIYLGVQLARADEQGRRDDAKKHLITVVIAIGVTVALILVFNTFMPAIVSAFAKKSDFETGIPDPEKKEFLNPLLMLLRA